MSDRKAIEVITNPIIKKHAKYSEDDDLYYISEVHIELLVSEIWQASRTQAIDECVNVCNRLFYDYASIDQFSSGKYACIDAIKELKEQP